MVNDPGAVASPKVVYWHRELPPLDTQPVSEHIVEADSLRVTGDLAHGGDLWDHCYRDLMTRARDRLEQEVRRLGGDCAHALEEAIGSRHDDRTSEVWLHGRFKYVLLRRQAASRDESRPTGPGSSR